MPEPSDPNDLKSNLGQKHAATGFIFFNQRIVEVFADETDFNNGGYGLVTNNPFFPSEPEYDTITPAGPCNKVVGTVTGMVGVVSDVNQYGIEAVDTITVRPDG